MPNGYGPAIERLEELWSDPYGVLYLLRQGRYDPSAAAVVTDQLAAIATPDESAMLPRRLVSLLWYLPTFLEWQRERVAEAGGDVAHLEGLIDQVRNRVEELLGVP